MHRHTRWLWTGRYLLGMALVGISAGLGGTTTAGATSATFQPKVDYATGLNPYSVAVGDLNGDAKPDLVTANLNDNTVSVLLNTTAKPTLSHVTRTGVARHGGSITLHWTLARQSGITGFSVYAGMHRLNRRVIPVHAARGYRYTTSWRGTGPYTLHILLRQGQQIVPLGG